MLAIALGNDSTAYVVHSDDRFGPNQYGMENERVMVLRRRAGRWRIETRLEPSEALILNSGRDRLQPARHPTMPSDAILGRLDERQGERGDG